MSTTQNKFDELDDAVRQSARSFDQFLDDVREAYVVKASLTDPITAHFGYVLPLREVRLKVIELLNLMSGLDVTRYIDQPELPTDDKRIPGKAWQRATR